MNQTRLRIRQHGKTEKNISGSEGKFTVSKTWQFREIDQRVGIVSSMQ